MSQQIILFDLANRQGQCWSLNPWKTRMYLNFKGLDYKTEWLEYPMLKPTFEKHLPPNPSLGIYTIPTIKLPDGQFIMDSKTIAQTLEKLHPSPSVHLDTPYLPKLEAIMPDWVKAISPETHTKVPKRILNEASVPYWHESRTKRFGMDLETYEREHGGQQAYDNMQPQLDKITAMLKENPEGPFFEGKQVTYADLQWAGTLRFLQRIGDDVFDKTISKDRDVHLALLEACQPWIQRDNY